MAAGEPRPRVLFLCTGNSCRSRMAEAFAHALRAGAVEALSAGTRPQPLDPRAARVMAECGIPIRPGPGQRPEDLAVHVDWVVTVCDAAHESCPVLPGHPRVVRRSFDDPPSLALTARDEEEALSHYRRVRDEIRAFVETLPDSLPALAGRPTKVTP